jgi:hypothetical protein
MLAPLTTAGDEDRQPVTGAAQLIEDDLALVPLIATAGRSARDQVSDLRHLRHTVVDARQRVRLVVDENEDLELVETPHPSGNLSCHSTAPRSMSLPLRRVVLEHLLRRLGDLLVAALRLVGGPDVTAGEAPPRDRVRPRVGETIGNCFRSLAGTPRSGASGRAGESVGSMAAVVNPSLGRRCPSPDVP